MRDRFIPAHAGNGAGKGAQGHYESVHPRACGEREPRGCSLSHDAGSSPRMRGTGYENRHQRSDYRFIPAHAGNGKW